MAKKQKDQKQITGEYRCYSCDHDQYEVVAELASTDYLGQLADGTKYTRVIRHRVQCCNCSQHSHFMQYEFDPADWQE